MLEGNVYTKEGRKKSKEKQKHLFNTHGMKKRKVYYIIVMPKKVILYKERRNVLKILVFDEGENQNCIRMSL